MSCGSVRLFCKEHMEAMDHTYMQQMERDCVRPLKELNAVVSDVCVRRDEWEAAMNDKVCMYIAKPLEYMYRCMYVRAILSKFLYYT